MLMIVNKNGGLVYKKVFSNNKKSLDDNELLKLASSFYSLSAIASQITPKTQVPPETEISSPLLDGIVEIVAETFVLRVMQTLTGVLILLVSEPQGANAQVNLLKKIYEAYADFVSKNPFQEAEQPIKSDYFESQIKSVFQIV
jgi:trafficking protein particle complex subunit 4